MKSVLRMTALLLFFICIQNLLAITLVSQKRHRSKLFITVDNELTEFKINDNKIFFPPGQGYNDWGATKRFEVVLFPGDEVSVTGKNEGGAASDGNPAGILATLVYVNKKGKERRIITNGHRWKCDGAAPLVQQKNNDRNAIWHRYKGGLITDIDGEAAWIWGQSKGQYATCTYKLPCKKY